MTAQVTVEQSTVEERELRNLSTKTPSVQGTPGQRASEAESKHAKNLDSSTQHTTGDFELNAEVTLGQSTAQESVSQTLSTKTPSAVSVPLTRGQGSSEAKCTPAKTMDSHPEHASSHFELDAQVTVEQSNVHESTSLTAGTHTPSKLSVELSPGQRLTEAKSTPANTLDSNVQHPEGKFELDAQMTMGQMTTQESTTQTPSKLSMELSPSQRSTEAKSSPTKASDRDPQQTVGDFELDAKVTVEQSTSHQSASETLYAKTPSKLSVEITPGQRSTQTTNGQAKTGQTSTEAKGRPAKTLDSDVLPTEGKHELDAEVTMTQSPALESPSKTLNKRPEVSVEITSLQRSTEAKNKPATTGPTSTGANSTQAKTLASEAYHAPANVELDAEVTMRQSITHKSTSEHNTQEHLSTGSPSKLSVEIGSGQTSTGICSTSTKILEGDAQKTHAKFSVQLSTGQTSTWVSSTPGKTVDNNEQQANVSFELDPTLRSSCVRKTTVEPDHGGETDSPPKPVFTIVLDTDLTSPSDSQPAADISVSGPQPSGLSHSDAVATQHREGMDVPEKNLEHHNAQTKTLELTAMEQPKLNQEEDLPSTKKVATIILDVEIPQTEATSKEVSAKHFSGPGKSDPKSCHGEVSPEELQSAWQEHVAVAPGQESSEDEKDMNQSSGEPGKSKTKKVFTIILEADASNSESLDSQNQEHVRKGSSEVSILPSGNSSLDLPKQPEISGLPEEICTSAADSYGHGPPESVLSDISCVEITPSENTHSVNVDLELSRQRLQDSGLLQPMVSFTSLEAAPSCTTTADPELRIAQIVLESRETELELSKQRSQDGGLLQSMVLSATLETAHSRNTTANPQLRIQESRETEPAHTDQTETTPNDPQEAKASEQSKSIESSLTDTRNRREEEDVDTVTSESADGEEKIETRQGRLEESDQGESEEANVVHIPVGHGPNAISTSPIKDGGGLQTCGTEPVQMDTSDQNEPDFQKHILSQSLEKLSPVTSKEEMHSLEVGNTDLPEIISAPEVMYICVQSFLPLVSFSLLLFEFLSSQWTCCCDCCEYSLLFCDLVSVR